MNAQFTSWHGCLIIHCMDFAHDMQCASCQLDWLVRSGNQSPQASTPDMSSKKRCNMVTTYSGVPNRRTGLNKRTGWNISQKLINAQGLIIIIL